MNQRIKYKPIITIKESKKAIILLAVLDGYSDPVIIKRLKGAAPDIYELLSRIENPHIPRIYEWEQQGEELVIAEEYVDGETLKTLLENGKLAEEQKLFLAQQLCEAVEVLHGCTPPVIHRDIKPSNILVSEDGVVRLIDFDASRQYKAEGNTSDTRILGTIEYAAPEQYGYMQTDVRSDIYSMGVVLNGLGFWGNPVATRLWKRVVDRCTNFDPGNRYSNVKKLAKDIYRVKVVQRHFGKLLCGLLCMMILLVGGIWLGVQKQQTMAEETGKKAEQSEINGAPASQRTPQPTNSVERAPSLTPQPTGSEEPTSTPQPASSEEPTPSPMPQPTSNGESAAWHTATDSNGKVVIQHVPWLEEEQEFLYYTSFFEMITGITEVAFRKQEELEIIVPEDAYYLKDSILHITGNYMRSLEAGEYEMCIKYDMTDAVISAGMSSYLRLYSYGENVGESACRLAGNYLDYWYGAHEKLHMVLLPNTTAKISGLYLNDEMVPENQYQILYDGCAIELSEKLLRPCKTQAELVLWVMFSDGTRESLVVANPYMRHYME